MKRTIEINNKPIEMASNAFTPILYRQIFKRDFLREITSLRKLAGKKVNEMSESDINETTDKAELFTQLAFVMAKQAELQTPDKLMALTQMDYFGWLTEFDPGAFNDPKTMGAIINLWKGNAEDKDIEAKNSEGREQET